MPGIRHNTFDASHKIPSENFCSPLGHQNGLIEISCHFLFEFKAISSSVCAYATKLSSQLKITLLLIKFTFCCAARNGHIHVVWATGESII